MRIKITICQWQEIFFLLLVWWYVGYVTFWLIFQVVPIKFRLVQSNTWLKIMFDLGLGPQIYLSNCFTKQRRFFELVRISSFTHSSILVSIFWLFCVPNLLTELFMKIIAVVLYPLSIIIILSWQLHIDWFIMVQGFLEKKHNTRRARCSKLSTYVLYQQIIWAPANKRGIFLNSNIIIEEVY